MVAFLQQTELHRWLGGSKRREDGTDCDLGISWSSEGWRPIRCGEGGDCHHVPSVADRAIAQGFAGQFFVEITIIGFGRLLDDAG